MREYLSASKLSLDFAKPADWGQEVGHPLGFASALLLFCVVDAIGSYHHGSKITFPVNGKECTIRSTGFQHFFVLNGPRYFGQALSHAAIKELYDSLRSGLAHNATILPMAEILFDPHEPELFPVRNNRHAVNLFQLHNRAIGAVETFLNSQHAEGSLALKNMLLKS